MANIVTNVGTRLMTGSAEEEDVGSNTFLNRPQLTKFVFDKEGNKYRVIYHAHPNKYEDVIFCEPMSLVDESHHDWEKNVQQTVHFDLHDIDNMILPNTEEVRDLLKIRRQVMGKVANIDSALRDHYYAMFQAHYTDSDNRKKRKKKKKSKKKKVPKKKKLKVFP